MDVKILDTDAFYNKILEAITKGEYNSWDRDTDENEFECISFCKDTAAIEVIKVLKEII